MDDLFEKLKAEPPVNRNNANKKTEGSDSPRRESLPALTSRSPSVPLNKSRSMSPTNRKSLVDEKEDRSSPVDVSTKSGTDLILDESSESRKKQMPTKAQQKLFEPVATQEIVAVSNVLKVKPCKVRIKRDNLVTLREKFTRENANKSKKASKSKAKLGTTSAKAGMKRKAESGNSPPAKKGRATKDLKQKSKPSSGFFIKLSSSPPLAKKAAVNKQRTKPNSPTTSRDKSPRKINLRGVSSSPIWTTKATKFTRTQLIKNFGKRFFNSTVKIERCRHPLMLTFEFNARARKLQARNKSKNLSVSFKEQVEIIGCSDTESNYSDENTTTAISDEKSVATPSRLKKIENGKVIDDIEFDPSLFMDPSSGSNSSTPLRKKTEKKSYSPLKDDSSSSARSEQLKMANEKLPPCGLRRLRDSTADGEDDEDDECEYIVPIDLPERRPSQTNSLNNTIDSTASTKGSDADGIPSIDDAADSGKTEKLLESTTDVLCSQNDSDGKENAEILKKDIETATAKKQDIDIEHINGNGTGTQNTDSQHKEDNSSNDEAVREENESLNLVLENVSSAVTPSNSFTPDSQESKSENLVKTVIDKITKDVDMPEFSNTQEKEQLTNVNNIIADKATPIST